MSISVNTTSGNSVSVTVNGQSTAEITTQTSTVTVTAASPNALTVTNKGPKGDTGVAGPTGPAGADGQGVPTGGDQFQILRKVSGTDYDTTWDYADRLTIEVRFDEAVSKGDPLYITGFNSGQNRVAVAKADAANPDKMPSIGLAFDNYSANDNGQATTIGSLDDVNTQVAPHDFQEGDVLYVKAGGGLTNVRPTGTNLIQNVGKVGRRQQNNGEIVVMAIGRSNDVPNIPNGQAWIGNASGVATPTTLATVATTGSYNDLSDKPTIPTDTNLGNADQSLSGTRVVDQQGENFEIDVNGGQFDLNDLSHNYISASSSQLSLQGIIWPASDGSSGQVLQTSGSGSLSFVTPTTPSRGGTYSYSGYSTNTNATTTFYYQFPSATSTSSTTDMVSGFVGQGVANATYGAQGGITLNGLSSTDQVTYSITVKVTTNTTIAIQALSPSGGQFTPATQFAFSNPSEQTITLTQASPTPCNNQGGVQWVMGLNVVFFAGGSINFRVEDFSITVS